jgi:hypothetical protein
MIPDIPGKHGEPSTSQIYINLLSKFGLNVSAAHYQWTGAKVFNVDHGVTAVHHYSESLDPCTFSKKTIAASKIIEQIIDKRIGKHHNRKDNHSRNNHKHRHSKEKNRTGEH